MFEQDIKDLEKKLTSLKEELAEKQLELRTCLSAASTSGEITDRILEYFVELVVKRLKMDAGSILFLDENTGRLYFRIAKGAKGRQLKKYSLEVGEGIAGWVAQTGEPVLIQDVKKDPRWKKEISEEIEYETRNLICVPIKMNDKILGVLEILNKDNNKPLKESDLNAALSVAQEIAVAMNTSKFFKGGQLKPTAQTVLLNTACLLNSTIELKKVLEFSMDVVKDVMGAEGSSILLLDKEKDELVFKVATGKMGEKLQEDRFKVKVGEGIAGQVAKTGKKLLISDAQTDPRFSKRADEKTGLETKSIMCVPLMVKDTLIGVLEAVNKKHDQLFDGSDFEFFSILANQVAVAIENARMYGDLRKAHAEIAEWNKTLQQKVEDRTKELADANEELKKLNQMKTDFLNIVAHDIRSPLTAITTFTQLMIADRSKLDERQMEGMLTIHEEGLRLNRLIDDLLDFAKMESGEIDWDMREIDFTKAVGHIYHLFLIRARSYDIEFESKFPKDLPLIIGDEKRLGQVLANIISNAFKFTPKNGKIEMKGEIIKKDGKKYLRVSISDTGPGISKQDQELIFEKFKQSSDKRKRTKGSGLGLFICREFIRHHNGDIWVESKPGKGSTFYFTLPI